MSSSAPNIVPLPSRQERRASNAHKPPVWPIDAAEAGTVAPLAAKCAVTSREDGICCKELIKDERTLVDPDIVRDVYVLDHLLLPPLNKPRTVLLAYQTG